MAYIDYLDLYAPLLPQRLPSSVRYVIVEGGRGSAKSFHASTALEAHTFQDRYDILFTRYTMTSANISIIPEFTEKIDLLNHGQHFEVKRDEVRNTQGGSILFRGLVQGSKNQTARLKSIPNLKIWVLDEAEELTSETTFDTIDLSLRKEGVHCQVWLVLNPQTIDHWIYRRFHLGNGIGQLEPNTCTTIGDTCIIRSTYEINDHLDAAFVARAERMKESNYDKYANIFLGEWSTKKEGLVYPDWEEITDAEYPTSLPQWYGLDWGYTDPTAVVRMCFDPLTRTLYLREVVAAHASIPADIAPLLLADAQAMGLSAGGTLVYCDSANPAGRDELRRQYSINAQGADKRDREYQVSWLRAFKVKYVGAGIKKEVKEYSFIPSSFDESVYTNKPQDGNDHFMDAIRYGAYTHLQRLI